MKKQKRFLLLGSLLLGVFIVVSAFAFYESSLHIKKGYLASEGKAAENFAILTAANISLTDKQVAELKAYSYAELLKSKENRELADMMDNNNFVTQVDYAYIMVHLKDKEIRYKVTEENKKRYDAPIGTKLDIMWLLDVNVGEDTAKQEINSEADELQRYSYYIEEDALIFGEAPVYIYNSSEWGEHICGYAPLYTTEGTYIGVVGVEMQTSDYNSYCGKAMLAMGVLMGISLFMLTLVFYYLYCQYREYQYEKIYTDALTKIGNRSYYNDQFIKRMNARVKSNQIFALMIADVDWFKKVNDTFGHEIGDAVLIELGAILLEIFGKEHVVRFGGEEFVAGLWGDNEVELYSKINLLFSKVEEHKFSKQEVTISISLGCSYCHVSELNGWIMSGMLKAADGMLYECKENGRQQYRVAKFEEATQLKKGK